MFLVDKYFNDSNQYVWHHSIIEKILDSFDTHTDIYSQIDNVMKNVKDVFLSQEVFLENETITKKYDISIMAIFKNETISPVT